MLWQKVTITSIGLTNMFDNYGAGPEGSSWEIAARGVESVALTDTCAWYVSAGKIYLQTELSWNRPFRDSCLVPCPSPALKVSCSQDVSILTSL